MELREKIAVELAKRNKTFTWLSENSKIPYSTLMYQVNNPKRVTVGTMEAVCNALEIDNPEEKASLFIP